MTQYKAHTYRYLTLPGLLFGCALAAFATLLLSNHSTLFNSWDDLRWKLLPARDVTPVYLVDIDEQSLAAYGRWPWPRETLAQLLQQLLDHYQASVVGVDIILSEAAQTEADRILGAADKERTVWAQAASLGEEPTVSQGMLGEAPRCPPDNPWRHRVNGWLGLAPTIAGDGFRGGHIRPWPDNDDVVRRYQPFLADPSRCVPALGLAMYGALLGLATDAPLTRAPGGWQWGGVPLALDGRGQLPLVWRDRAVRAVPAHRVLAATAQLPTHSVIVVGSSAVGIGDFVRTASTARYPGAGIHAQAVRQWLDRDFTAAVPYPNSTVWALLTVVFALFWWTSGRAAWVPWLTASGLFAGWNLAAWLLWQNSFYLATQPMLWSLLWLPLLQGVRLWQEKSARQRIYRQFHAYVPEKVLQALVRSGVDPRQLDAQSREITILFADLRGFTSLSEAMSPEHIVTLLNEVMEYLCQHVSAQDGTLDKFMGDGLMAFWGAPVEQADHADRAVSCARAMLDNLELLNERLHSADLPAISLGIGINSGRVAVGNMGSASRKNYSAVGDAVNTAARLQQACKSMACELLIGADTAALCRQQALTALGRVPIRGKKEPVLVYTYQPPAATHKASQ